MHYLDLITLYKMNFLKFYLSFLSFLFFVSTATLSAQCNSCTVTNPVLSGNYTFLTNSVVCFTSNATLGDVTFQNNSTICIAPGVTVIIQNNVSSNTGNKVTFNVQGILQFNQAAQINANCDVLVSAGGIFRGGPNGTNNFTFNGLVNNLTSYGQVRVGVLQWQNGSGVNQVDNYKLMQINNNINISGTTTFRNWDTLNIGQSYNNNSTSAFINCAYMSHGAGYNIGGGRIINTGQFLVPNSSIDFGNGGRFFNYGTVVSGGTANTTNNALLYNEGLFRMNNFQGDGRVQGPASGSGKRGFIELTGSNRININQNNIGPNLDFTHTNGSTLNGDGRPNTTKPGAGQNGTNVNTNRQWLFQNFNGSFTEINTITFDCRSQGNCPQPLVTAIGQCPNWDGSFVDIALSMTADRTEANVERLVAFTIDIRNFGPNDATGVQVSALLPDGFTFDDAWVNAGSYDANTGIWNIGNLSAGHHKTLTLFGKVKESGSLSLTATASANQTETNTNNNSASIDVIRKMAYHDNAAAVVNVQINGNVSLNDQVETGTIYSTPVLSSSPAGSSPSISLSADGSYTFTGNVPGTYVYEIKYCGIQQWSCPTQLLTITVSDAQADDALPILFADAGIGAFNQSVTLQTLSNDFSGNTNYSLNPATVSIVQATAPDMATQGSLQVNPLNGNITFIPVNGFTGTVTYTYEVCNNAPIPQCSQAEQNVTILPNNAVNGLIASDDFLQTNINTAVNGNALINDMDAFNFMLSATPQQTTINGVGTLNLLADGSFSFVPAMNFVGVASFPYTVCNNNNPVSCATAVIEIFVRPNNVALPVSWLSFKAKMINNGVELNWATAMEQNNDYFVVERSLNGVTFKSIGQVKGSGNTKEERQYTFFDANPLQGLNYYRIKQVDFNGESAYSRIAIVRNSIQNTASIYPNPVKDILNIQILDTAVKMVRLFDAQGRQVMEATINNSNAHLDLGSLQHGVYFLQFDNGTINKIIKN